MAGLRNIFSRLGNWTREHTSEAVLYCCSVIAVFSFLGTRALFGSENRWAEAVREMLLTGDIFHPCLNGVVYFDKPIMSYWLIYLATRATGVLNEWIVRLPSAVFAVLAVWCTVRLFSMLFDRRTGVLSGWFLLASWGFLWWGRSAEADMENMAFILFAFTWFIHCRERANFFHYLVFYLLIFVGALFKGLPAVAVSLALVAVFTVGDGWAEVRRQLKFANFAALLVGGGCYFLTLYISGIIPLATGCRYPQELSALDLVWRENVVRVFSAFDHRSPPQPAVALFVRDPPRARPLVGVLRRFRRLDNRHLEAGGEKRAAYADRFPAHLRHVHRFRFTAVVLHTADRPLLHGAGGALPDAFCRPPVAGEDFRLFAIRDNRGGVRGGDHAGRLGGVERGARL